MACVGSLPLSHNIGYNASKFALLLVGGEMANTPQPFRQHHLTRALRAAKAAGMDSVKVRLPSGVEFHIGGGEVPTAKPKRSAPLRADLAEGGDTKMAGRGDRTTTAPEDSAGTQRSGGTAHKTSSRGSRLAEGGKEKMFPKQAAQTAKAGQTGKPVSDPKQASGGLSRPARPGECGT